MSQPIGGRRRFRGRLLGLANDDIRMSSDGEEIVLPFSAIAKAKLIMSDELVERLGHASPVN